MTFKYQKPWEQYLASLTDPDDRNLYGFLENLEGEALLACLEDILTKQVSHLSEMFPKSQDRFVSTEDQFFDDLMDAPRMLIKRTLSRALDKLFYKALNGDYRPNLKTRIIRRIYALTAKNKVGLSSQAISDITETRNGLDATLRLQLLMLLSKLEDFDDYSFWCEIREQIPQRPYVGAAVIEAFRKEHAWEALDVLLDYNKGPQATYEPTPEHLEYFGSALEMALYNCLKGGRPQDIALFNDIKKKVGAPWLSDLLDDSLGHPRFRHLIKHTIVVGPPVTSEVLHPLFVEVREKQPGNLSTELGIPAESSDNRSVLTEKDKGKGTPQSLNDLFEHLYQNPQ